MYVEMGGEFVVIIGEGWDVEEMCVVDFEVFDVDGG